MKFLLLLAIVVPLAAQQPDQPPPAAQPAPAKQPAPTPAAKPGEPPAAQPPTPAAKPGEPAAAQPAPTPGTQPAKPTAKAPAEAPSPVPSTESWLTGSIDFGYRWRTDVGGSADTYRSIVNLGSGPKLLGAEFSLSDPKKRLFDQLHVRAYGWGDDPYSSFHLDARKSKLYEFRADYRDIVYYNNLASFADPLLIHGVALDEQSFDTRRRLASFELDLLPGHSIVPYVAFSRDSGAGTGVTTFVSDADEFPVPNSLRDSTNLYRGGLRIELRRFHATLEQGGTTFKDDQSVFWNGALNYGNVVTPFFGQTLDLSNLLGAYGIRGTSLFSKALVTASPAPWLDLYGQFLYSQPDSTIHYQQQASGNLLLQSQLLFYNAEQYLVSGAAKLPHTSGSLGAEIRPFSRVRIVQSWLTDRMHNSGSTSSSQTLAGLGFSSQMSALLASSLATNYNQEEIDVFFDVTSRLTVRGGYRYVWGDGSDVVLPAEGLAGLERASFHRNTGLGGAVFHASSNLSISGDAEGSSSGGVYFRTSLYNYQRVRARARYQLSTSLNVSADFTLLNNQNPTPGIRYDFLSHQESLSLQWSPKGGKTWDVEGSYSRSTARSDINYLAPQVLTPQRSFYRDNAHTATALFHIKLPHAFGLAPELSGGGSFFISSGSRPSSYYQPIGKLSAPMGKRIACFAEWRYYGYGEAFYLFEGFRTHLLTAGLRWTL
jgi:hypothetical protein